MVSFSPSTLAATVLSLSLVANAAIYDTQGVTVDLTSHRRFRTGRSPAHHLPLARRASEKPTKKCRVKPAVKNTGGKGSSGSGSSGGSSGGGFQTGGVIKVSGGACGNNGATSESTKTSGPNGAITWINCGIDGDGWTPPEVKMSDIVAKDLSTILEQDGNPFGPCKQYIDIFNKYADKYDIPAIFIASFAMQESSCNKKTIGEGGEQGIMQISGDKCEGAPGDNCLDPDFNIGKGSEYFANVLKDNNGHVLLALGEYNGWFDGMTYAKATAARTTGCCRCQKNLDYLHQFLNGWTQGIDPYSKNMGKYFNLDVCDKKGN